MIPSVDRRGGEAERITYTMADSFLGRMLVAATERGVCALGWGADEELVTTLRDRFPKASVARDDRAISELVQKIDAHLRENKKLPAVPLDTAGTEFQRRVWEALRQIPIGETRTYSEMAGMLGRPTSARAVARACATNPVALFIPCHRIVRANGDLAGYRWGIERKEALLAIEGRASDSRRFA